MNKIDEKTHVYFMPGMAANSTIFKNIVLPGPQFEPGDTLDLRIDGLGSRRQPCR